MAQTECDVKVAQVRRFMADNRYSAALLASRAGFSWLTGGGHSYVNSAVEAGVAVLAVTADSVVLLCSNIEGPRFRDEEIGGLPITIRDFPWHDAAARTRAFAEVVGAGRAAADIAPAGVACTVERGLVALRFRLLPAEIERYREAGRRFGAAIGEAARRVRPGQTEFQAAAEIHTQMLSRGMFPWVTLVASDERIRLYRHPVPHPTKTIERTVMLVCCAEYRGLIVAVTRLVSFGSLDADTIVGTRVGRPLSEVLADGVAAYREVGFADEWRFHHQGGPCGYQPRDAIANPHNHDPTQLHQAFAWNPSIAGTKSEDTILITDSGPEIISDSPDWPMVPVMAGRRTLPRPDILIR
jgi:hypothetical protein